MECNEVVSCSDAGIACSCLTVMFIVSVIAAGILVSTHKTRSFLLMSRARYDRAKSDSHD